MFYALAKDLIPSHGLEFQHIFRISKRSMSELPEVDVSAISIHAYAYVSDQYALLPSGAVWEMAGFCRKNGPFRTCCIAKSRSGRDDSAFLALNSIGCLLQAELQGGSFRPDISGSLKHQADVG